MKYLYSIFILISLLIISACSSDSGRIAGDVFGDEITLEKTTSLSDILSDKDANVGKEFLVKGVMINVCQKKGCWMDLKDGENEITVRFKDYAFFMPKDGAGRNATVQGVFTKDTYEDEDENGNKVMKDYYQIIASGVVLEK